MLTTTHTTLKSKWHSFKTWIIPDLNKRRPSQCSTATTVSNHTTSCCCQSQESIYYSERISIDTEQLNALYCLAVDELNYAEDSRGSPYYSGDRMAAKEAIEHCKAAYDELRSRLGRKEQVYQLESTLGRHINTLDMKYNALPLQDDQISF